MNKIFGLFLLAFAFLAPDLAHAANRFAVCTGTCTWDSTSTAMWCATDTGCTGATAPVAADAVIFNANTCVGGVTCTVTVDSTINGATFLSITAGACTASTTGCILDFSVNNPSITVSSLISLSGTGTRKYLLGSGTFTITTTIANTPFDLATTTNLDATSNLTANFVYSANTTVGRTFAGGGRTYGSLTIASNSLRGAVVISGANTFSSISVAAGTWLQIAGGTTTTITNAPTWAGTASSPISIQTSNFNSGAATLSIGSGTFTCDFCGLFLVTGTGGATFSATNSFDFGRNTNITISPPSGGGGGGGRIIGG